MRVVVYDACVLYPAPVRDLLIRLARAGLVRAHWTDQILDECFRSILRTRPELSEPLRRTRALLIAAVPGCLIDAYEDLIDGLTLPDPDDRHVLAAAIRASARSIITFNLKDFPADILAQHQVEAIHPDELVLDLIEAAPAAVTAVLMRQVADLRSPPQSVEQVMELLGRTGLPMSMARLRGLFGG
jgi:predicted nucleic acid-binding protein